MTSSRTQAQSFSKSIQKYSIRVILIDVFHYKRSYYDYNEAISHLPGLQTCGLGIKDGPICHLVHSL